MDHEGVRRISGAVLPEPGKFMVDVSPPDGRRFWLDDNMMPTNRNGEKKPTFSIAQIAKIFFARSADWVRWLSNQGRKTDGEAVFVLDGKPLEAKRTESGSRYYTLADVERVAHALLEHEKIDTDQFLAALQIVLWMAYSYDIVNLTDLVPDQEPDPNAPVQEELFPIEEVTPAPAAPASKQQVPEESCEPCSEGRHHDCAVAMEIQEKLVGGPVTSEVDVTCPCYERDPFQH